METFEMRKPLLMPSLTPYLAKPQKNTEAILKIYKVFIYRGTLIICCVKTY
jgi:hypothetical protein